ncbi:hypothetical protein EQG63_11190 [Flavobacterium amnicola]|uniref:Uncharacterized protein n=1 Tax=Flavobacterium amnicola TaxID=2506422 RepID=A0A4Q1K185_9FLAO|nr:hypothetical protein EQG63_11190 [Flavobacterium amnicola]
MMTYKSIQELYKETFNRTIKTCWIADVKRELGQTTRKSYNRLDDNTVKYPCPNDDVRNWLIQLLS